MKRTADLLADCRFRSMGIRLCWAIMRSGLAGTQVALASKMKGTNAMRRFGKVLSVSIAAYNVSPYIKEALDSCLIEDANLLDVIVVDDGATDDSAAIVQRYVDKYPDTFRLVRKSNGGYGTTVNASLAIAEGAYFKLLDGDDWFDSGSLAKFVALLSRESYDLVFSPYCERKGNDKRLVNQASGSLPGAYSKDDHVFPGTLSMHSITYRTSLLRNVGISLPANRLYTDTLFNVIPLAAVDSIYVTDDPVYQYRVGRVGQSMSRESILAHRGDLELVLKDLLELRKDLPGCTLQKDVLDAWMVADASLLLEALYAAPTSPLLNEIELLLATLRSYPEAYKTCRQRSKRFRVLSSSPRLLSPLIRKAVVT